ncbi:uncharacterized protein LOC129232682, partial [Uloborus diversus]|uniref:uncharacterized protein LOC129232682 n=1 Tax=Uloborus diversus TaxID=327109 RepID=UPI00240A7CFB
MDNAILHDNYNLSLKRLESTCRNLDKRGLRDKYDEVFDEWIQEGIIEELSNSEIDMPAHYLPHRPVIKEKDASQVAYAACVFIRCEYSGRGVSVQLLQAKARITPLKPITIPRLELMAATIGARLYVSLKESLNLEQ